MLLSRKTLSVVDVTVKINDRVTRLFMGTCIYFFFFFFFFFFYIHNLKIYNLTKHVYNNDTIGSMIGMATLNDLLTKNQYRY